MMSTYWKASVIAGLVLGLGLPAVADPRPKGAITPVEVDEYGLPVVRVRLSSKKPGVPDREFRFIFDTGATLNVIDASVPADFFWEEPDKIKGVTGTAVDGTGTAIAARIVVLKRLELAGMTRDDLMAYRMDLKGTMFGRIQDEPVDGMLGMNFLRGTRFVLDSGAREILWWQDIPGHRIPMSIDGTDRPTLIVKVGSTDVPCMLDTGGNGGIQMPGNADASEHTEPFGYSSASGETREGVMVMMERLESGGKAWTNVPLDLIRPGDGRPTIGLDVLGAAPLGLDFIDLWATFTLDPSGNLPYRKTPLRPLLGWERAPEGNRLVVLGVNPASRWAKAGAKEGDEVLAIGNLTGKALTLRSALAFSTRREAHTWRIRRDGVERVLSVPEGE